MGMMKEFRDFAVKGNVVDLAVAVIIGGAFGKIITALVDNILMPFIGSLMGKSFDNLAVKVNGVDLKYGTFIQAAVDFIIVAFVLFLIVKVMNTIKKKEAAAPAGPTVTEKLLTEIRDALKK